MTTVTLDVSYAQLAVFDARLPSAFNDWTDAHVNQGFSWRPGSVSFATLDAAGAMAVTLIRSGTAPPQQATPIREIVVPFTVPPHGEVDVATISGSVAVQLPAGEYALTFRHGRLADGSMWSTLSFDPVASPVKAEIVRADDALRPTDDLSMTAQPA